MYCIFALMCFFRLNISFRKRTKNTHIKLICLYNSSRNFQWSLSVVWFDFFQLLFKVLRTKVKIRRSEMPIFRLQLSATESYRKSISMLHWGYVKILCLLIQNYFLLIEKWGKHCTAFFCPYISKIAEIIWVAGICLLDFRIVYRI